MIFTVTQQKFDFPDLDSVFELPALFIPGAADAGEEENGGGSLSDSGSIHNIHHFPVYYSLNFSRWTIK
jgi:hypothetical protein